MTIAIITGGSRGFGFALTGALAAKQWNVVIDGRDRTSLDTAARQLGDRVHVVAGDVAEHAHREALVSAADQLGGLDLLVNNAGALGPSPLPRLSDIDPEDLVDLFRVNVAAPLALTQLALPQLTTRGGAVVNITSDAAVEAYEGWGAYGSST